MPSAAPTLDDALALHRQGRYREARRLYEKLAAKEPRNARLHSMIGVAAHQEGQPKVSARALAKATALEPDNAEYQSALGFAELQQGRLDAAATALDRALALAPQMPDVHANLGDLARARGERAAAERHYQAALDRDDRHARAWFGLANVLGETGDAAGALRAVAAASAHAPFDTAIADGMDTAASVVPLGWHLDMLADGPRNAVYRAAIERAVADAGPDAPVLEIGAGSGLMAMIAARAGARRVVACEGDPRLAAVATEIVARNGLADRVTIVPKRSTDLRIGEDLPARAGVVIGEIFDGTLLGEDALVSFGDAADRLVAADARWVPPRGRIHAAVIEDPAMRPRARIGEVEGFDLSPFNRLVTRRAGLSGGLSRERRLLTEPTVLFELDFAAPSPLAGRTARPVSVRADGAADAILLWFSLDFGGGLRLDNDPEGPPTHWPHGFQILVPGRTLTAGETVTIEAEYFRQLIFADLAAAAAG